MATMQKVLIVDDEVKLCELVAMHIEMEGFEIFTANNGFDAFEIIKKENIDAVISDVKMPNGNGIELLKNVCDHPLKGGEIQPVVILISGFSDVSAEQAVELGAYVKLNKPMDYDELTNILNEALSKRDQFLQ